MQLCLSTMKGFKWLGNSVWYFEWDYITGRTIAHALACASCASLSSCLAYENVNLEIEHAFSTRGQTQCERSTTQSLRCEYHQNMKRSGTPIQSCAIYFITEKKLISNAINMIEPIIADRDLIFLNKKIKPIWMVIWLHNHTIW